MIGSAGLATWIGYVARALLNVEQYVGASEPDVADGQREVVALLLTWHAKRSLLDRPSEMLLPQMVGSRGPERLAANSSRSTANPRTASMLRSRRR